MPNAIYFSVVSRLAAQAPMVAKGLLNAALQRSGLSPETVTPFQMKRLLETELRAKIESASRNAIHFENTGMGVVAANGQGAIVHMDPFVRSLLGYPIPDDPFALHERCLEKRLLVPASDFTPKRRIRIFTARPDAGGMMLKVTCVAAFGEGGILTGLTSAIEDVTLPHAMEMEAERLFAEVEKAYKEIKRAQEQMVRSETLASLGGMVAGLAHEINTPLGIGVTAATLLDDMVRTLRQSYEKDTLDEAGFDRFITEATETAQLILSNLTRAAALVRSFKMVSADQTSQELRRFRLREYIEDIVRSLQPKLRKTGTSVELECADNLEMTNCPGALAQVLTNLIVNAIVHAYEGRPGGIVYLSAHQDGEKVSLRVRDEGGGIPADSRKRIFDPFFTTKRGKGGTGLGLNIVYNLVTQSMRGRIECQSQVGKGTTFVLALPQVIEGEGGDPLCPV